MDVSLTIRGRPAILSPFRRINIDGNFLKKKNIDGNYELQVPHNDFLKKKKKKVTMSPAKK